MQSKPRLLASLDIVCILLFASATFMVFFYAPLEVVMGMVQKVFYFHVASLWVGMLGFLVGGISGVIFLRTGNHHWDIVGLAAIEISLVFFFIGIVTGSIWARSTWNTWWTWDPRLTSAAIVELIYAAYFILRGGIDEPVRRARYGAIYAILGFVSVPLTFFSIRLFRTIHPVVIGNVNAGSQGTFNMAPMMLQTFIFSLFVFTILFADLLWHRIRLGQLAEDVEQRKLDAFHSQ
ncbi:MAG: cytochrome c biogenesis protein CcsA [Chloroflexota bacterium]|jgi:heme exporter protein C